MISLNIVPDKIKKEIKINQIYSAVNSILLIFIVVSLLFGIILITAEIILKSALEKEVKSATLVFKEDANTAQKTVNEINNKILKLESVQNDFIKWSSLLNYISRETPDGIVFNRISISKEAPVISFSGNAKDRDILISFKEFLENSVVFENVDFPGQNLLLRENINFEIKSKIKIDEIY